MKIIYFISIQTAICIAVLIAAFSCDSFVEVDLPKSQLIRESVFDNYNTADAALSDIYSNIRTKGLLTGGGVGISGQLGCYADELISTEDPDNFNFYFYTNNLLPESPYVAAYWNETYSQIYASNAVIEGALSSKNLTTAQKNQLQGQALFIRSLLHFYLYNIFGEIPYITHTDYSQNSTVHRMTEKEVYKNIITDLEKASTMLSSSFASTARVRPNALTVQALLARVYLYQKSYPEAADLASAVINQTQLFKLENPSDVFLLNSKETIWQLHSGIPGDNTADARYFIFFSAPPQAVWLNEALVNSFLASDIRRKLWIKGVSDGLSTWYHPYKYKEYNATASSKEYTILLRLAEQYLIRAEARAMQGDLIGAKEDLNKVRQRAGLSETHAQTQLEIIEAVLTERKWELFTESGHRFFDLKRNGRLDSTLFSVKKGWKSTNRLFPIPQSELSINPNLRPQNPGY